MNRRSIASLVGALVLMSPAGRQARAAEIAEAPVRAMELSVPAAGANAPLLVPSALPQPSHATDLSARPLDTAIGFPSSAGAAAAVDLETPSRAEPSVTSIAAPASRMARGEAVAIPDRLAAAQQTDAAVLFDKSGLRQGTASFVASSGAAPRGPNPAPLSRARRGSLTAGAVATLAAVPHVALAAAPGAISAAPVWLAAAAPIAGLAGLVSIAIGLVAGVFSVGPALNYPDEQAAASAFLLAGGMLMLGSYAPYYLLVAALLTAVVTARSLNKIDRRVEGLAFLAAGLGALAALVAAGTIDGFAIAVGGAVALASLYRALGKLAPQR